MDVIQKGYIIFLFVIAIIFLIWGLAGFFEYFTGIVPFIPLQNSYPAALQFLHWLFLTLFGMIFSIGYLKRWKYLPWVSIILFSNGALLCTIETLDFSPENWGIVPYVIEIATYLISSAFVLLSPISKQRFNH